jgi:hypothetical protein
MARREKSKIRYSGYSGAINNNNTRNTGTTKQ